MNYLTTKELAKKWNISPTRIAVMAKKGQIKGAILMGNNWLFPEDAKKPSDKRYKKNNEEDNHGSFHFPIYAFSFYEKDNLTNEELSYFELEKLFYSLDFDKAYLGFKNILSNTKSLELQIGCLYYLCPICGMLRKYDEGLEIYKKLTDIFKTNFEHKKELSLLYSEVKEYVLGNQDKDLCLKDYLDVDHSITPYISLLFCYETMIKYLRESTPFDINYFELLCMNYDDGKCPLLQVDFHLHVALLNGFVKDENSKINHLRKAIDIAIKNNIYYSLIVYLPYLANYKDHFKDLVDLSTLIKLSEASKEYQLFLKNIKEYASLVHLPKLDIKDFEYLSYLIKGLSGKEVAELTHLSEVTISKKYKALKEKMGVKTKKELLEKYRLYLTNRD